MRLIICLFLFHDTNDVRTYLKTYRIRGNSTSPSTKRLKKYSLSLLYFFNAFLYSIIDDVASMKKTILSDCRSCKNSVKKGSYKRERIQSCIPTIHDRLAYIITSLQVPSAVILLKPQDICQSSTLFLNGLVLVSVKSSEKNVTLSGAVVFQ